VRALILVAEADTFNLRLLEEVCEATGHEVATASDGPSALDAVGRRRPDLVLLDVALPMSGGTRDSQGGLEVLRRLKADPELAAIPVLVTTHENDVEARRGAIALGAEDYVARPYRVFEIQQRLRNALRRVVVERRLLALGDEDLLDPLTRAGSAGQLQTSLEYETTRAVRYGHALSCLSLKIGGLDRTIAEHGRQAGDGLLVQITQGVRGCIRGIDHLFRADRDELVILLPETSATDARIVLDRLRERDADGALTGPAIAVAPRIEVGIAGRPEVPFEDGQALLSAARAARRPLAL